MKYLVLFLVLVIMSSCSPSLRSSFKKLSKPEKTWVFFHSFKAKKAYTISTEVEKTKDSIAKTSIIGTDNNGGRLDAFKHSFWMARLTQGIGKRAAHSLGKAHEKGNYQTYKRRQFEDGFLPDKPSSDMDLYNNKIGIAIGNTHKKSTKKILIYIVLDSLHQGKLRVLSKDENGDFLDCQKKVIPLDSLRNQWDTKKCLVSSDN